MDIVGRARQASKERHKRAAATAATATDLITQSMECHLSGVPAAHYRRDEWASSEGARHKSGSTCSTRGRERERERVTNAMLA